MKKEAIDIYRSHLSDLSDSHLSNAIERCFKERKFKDFPTIADIRYYAGVDLETIAKDAIEKLKRAAKKLGDGDSIAFTDKTLNAVAAGYDKWSNICAWGPDDWSYNYKRLVELYGVYKRNGTTEERIKGHYESLGHRFLIKYVGEVGQKVVVSEYQVPEKKSALLSYQDIINQIIDNCEEIEDDESDNLPLILK